MKSALTLINKCEDTYQHCPEKIDLKTVFGKYHSDTISYFCEKNDIFYRRKLQIVQKIYF